MNTKKILRKYKGADKSRPAMWKTGTDPQRHAQYRAWMLKKTQARYRHEAWSLSFEDFEQLWSGRWFMRGRDGLWLTRVDNTRAWSKANCRLATRSKHFKHVLKNYKGLKYSKTKHF